MSAIRIEDLDAPVLDDMQRAAIEYARSQSARFDEQDLRSAAEQRTGLHDFGDPSVWERVRRMIDAIESDRGLNALGRLILHQRLARLLSNRLLVEDTVRRYPEIEAIPIERPIIVLGLPRSGTTHLVNLIAADRRWRALPYWESLEPVANRGDGPGRNGVDPRYERCRRSYDAQMQIAPLVRAMHHQYPEAIEEEIELQDIDFASYTLEWHARVPQWRDYYFTLDQRAHYRYLRKVLQVCTFFRGPRRWVLKSPQHLEQIDALVETFPDATFAITHRDPVAVIQSAVTMLAYGDRVRRQQIQCSALAEYWVDRVERLLRACARDHSRLPAAQTFDVFFHEFMADDVATVASIYARAGMTLDDRTRATLDAFLRDNRRGKHGTIDYDLARDFGIDPGDVRARFDFYFERFPVEVEDRR